MPDREKVIKGLQCRGKERCGYFCERTGACYYAQPAFSIDGEIIGYGCNTEKLCSEALELLKEQEPTKTKASAAEPIKRVWTKSIEYVCAACSHKVGLRYRGRDIWYFRDDECKNCGRSVKWE